MKHFAGITAVSRAVDGRALSSFLISVPSEIGSRLIEVRREALEALIEAGIEALDAADGDADLEEDNEDCCTAGDDWPASGPAIRTNWGGFSASPSLYCLGMDEDMERESWSTFGGQTDPLN